MAKTDGHNPRDHMIGLFGCLLLAASLLSLLLFLPLAGLRVYAGVSAHQFTADIRLADDASTPELKAKYLGDFLAHAEAVDLPQNVNSLVPTSQSRVANNLDVVRSLKQRCDDLSKLDKNSMGYSQGMTQITGQEFDHALSEPQSRLEDAMITARMTWAGRWGWWLSIALLVVVGCGWGLMAAIV